MLVLVIVSVCSASASVVSIEGRVLVNNKIKACSNDRGKELGIITKTINDYQSQSVYIINE